MTSAGTWLVIPCFNEERRLSLTGMADALETFPGVHLCMVDDGSADGTLALLSAFAESHPGRVTVLRHDLNRGKAEAVRTGVLHGLDNTGHQRLGYWDADLATPLDELSLFERETERTPDWDILMGCRHQRLGTKIRRKKTRHYTGRVFATMVSQLLDLPVYDTQCGAKIFRRDVIGSLFSRPFRTTWIFDVELLARYIAAKGREAALERIREVPLDRWTDVGGSKLSPAAYLKAIGDLFILSRTYAAKRGSDSNRHR
ncbi:Poly-beta-1,6-N-acetyl-D-glucosamine synthase [Pseudodesulfovibrio hydrargyri]|uniref:Poly-beta-1,6-N-acetyl-D-glucosamine synthase n=1 Tax=Pseudodesulfovibrio hydrargyri TaxID=2125990 RepID=A0A1J5MR12_9BACT|nr:glycosyltransferase [Pseudodesulfovibrio hydrargyri]OIQ49038.1 Poly-beta-1,6-N-acetyl-D-glucosamine synthase [Pseudodesulfovibrio hydrargyri]